MHVLWLTLCDPHPQTNGQFLYSGGLICAVAKAGARVTVLGLARQAADGDEHREPGVEWCLAADRPASRWRRLLSRYPSSALRTWVPEMQTMLGGHLQSAEWDALVLDSINVAWAVPRLVRYRRNRPRTKIAYLAQNNETQAALELAKGETGWRRAIRLMQAAKSNLLERQLVRVADLVTADAPDDCGYLSGLSGGRPVLFVPPGYEGIRVRERTIGSRVPRRAIVVGSFDWAPKRISLEAFLVAAVPVFARRGVELQVIGRTDPSYVADLRRRFPGVEFTGSVPEVRTYMENARIGLVPDLLGGFKLKSLDYVFSRVPIFGIEGAVAGTGLKNGEAIRLVENHAELVNAVADAIDDFDYLNRLQRSAFSHCEARFDWKVIGYDLVRAIATGWNTGSGLAEYSVSSA